MAAIWAEGRPRVQTLDDLITQCNHWAKRRSYSVLDGVASAATLTRMESRIVFSKIVIGF
jgi:hypothetical protein